ncbi:hypothetical protein [Prevotella sp. 10(H)]|uniref:hypothetical protein n=1 Tax=Prevotella sp. 10(H) TaxID=1158294 RepID=UPI000A71C7BE|nr:hypothetical protein [Prevotella sp. 10(H)]
MRKFCLSVLFFVLLPVFYFSSCAKDENDESEFPTISDVRVNINDTLRYGQLVVRINDSLNTNPQRLDTLISTKWMYISARFTDNHGLSSYKVELYPLYKDKRGREDRDSIMPFIKLGQRIFNQTDITVHRNRLGQIPDTINRVYKTGERDTLVLVHDTYNAKVAVIDKAGNADSITNHKVVLLSRKALYDIRVGTE